MKTSLLLSLIVLNAVCAQRDPLIRVKPITQKAQRPLPLEENNVLDDSRRGGVAETQRPLTFQELNFEIIQEHLNNPQLSGSVYSRPVGSFSGQQGR